MSQSGSVSPRPPASVFGRRKSSLEKDLWAYTWSVVEKRSDKTIGKAAHALRPSDKDTNKARTALSDLSNRGCLSELSIEVYTGVRRRLIGKQPPKAAQSAVDVFSGCVRRRILGKQRPQQKVAESGASRDSSHRGGSVGATVVSGPMGSTPRGYYDRLGLCRNAAPAEIRIAYRRQALATHPDKGGDAEYFHQVTAAFEELADAARRAAYDRNLVFFGCRDGLAPDGRMGFRLPVPEPQERPVYAGRREYGDARVLQEQLLLAPMRSWTKQLSETADRILEALCNLLLSGTEEGAANANLAEISLTTPWGDVFSGGGDHQGCASGSNSLPHNGASETAANGVGGKFIRRHKRGYIVQVAWASLSVSTAYTQSLAQAIDWQIALMSAQGDAQARLLGIHECGDLLEPFTEEEWLGLLAAEPSIRPIFRLVFRVGGRKGRVVQTPGVQNFRLALDFRRRFAASLGTARLEKARAKAAGEAAGEMRERRTREGKLRRAVLWEMQSRASVKQRTKAQTRGIADRPSGMLGRGKNVQLTSCPLSTCAGVKRRRESSPTRTRKNNAAAADATPLQPKRRKSLVGRASPIEQSAATPPKPRKVCIDSEGTKAFKRAGPTRLRTDVAASDSLGSTSPADASQPRTRSTTRRRSVSTVPAKISKARPSGSLPLSHWFVNATASGGG